MESRYDDEKKIHKVENKKGKRHHIKQELQNITAMNLLDDDYDEEFDDKLEEFYQD